MRARSGTVKGAAGPRPLGLALVIAACAPASEPALGDARWPFGDPAALAVAADGTRIFSAEGASATELELVGEELREGRRFVLEASVHALAADERRLFVAGGRYGLLALELGEEAPRVRCLHAPAELVCTDVELAQGRVFATFGALEGSVLLVLDARTLAVEAEVALPPGIAWAVAARGRRAWVALGREGLARIELDDPRRPHVRPGPGGSSFEPPHGVAPEARVLRDLALSPTHLFAAADGAGLASIALAEDWSPHAPVRLWRPEGASPGFACRVACEGELVAVAFARARVDALEGAPFGPHGWMDAELAVGGLDPSTSARTERQMLALLEHEAGGLRLRTMVDADEGGWRTLVLRGDLSFEQHIGTGLVVRALEGPLPRVLARRTPAGLAVIDAALSLRDPSLVLCALDPAGSRSPGWPRVAADAFEIVPGTEAMGPLGLLLGPQWLDEAGAEWCLAGGGEGWRLWRIDPERPERSGCWEVMAPPDVDGRRGLTYFSAARAGDLLLCARARSREGLVAASAAELVANARAAPPGTRLKLRPRAVLRTHEAARPRRLFTWRPACFTDAVGRLVALVPAGFDTSEEEGVDGRAQWLLLDLSAALEGRVERLGRILGPPGAGHARAVAVQREEERVLAALVDFVRGVELHDVTEPERAERIAAWSAPLERFDGRASNVLDVELERDAARGTRILVAAGRLGLVELALDATAGSLEPVSILPTPGWAAGLRLCSTPQGPVLLLAEQKAGLRLFRR